MNWFHLWRAPKFLPVKYKSTCVLVCWILDGSNKETNIFKIRWIKSQSTHLVILNFIFHSLFHICNLKVRVFNWLLTPLIGAAIEASLKQLAERRTDIFGVGDEETAIGKKIGEEDIRKDDKVSNFLLSSFRVLHFYINALVRVDEIVSLGVCWQLPYSLLSLAKLPLKIEIPNS